MDRAIHVPWYATGLRGDRLEAALADVTPTALRYGATSWSLHRSRDDRHKFLQIVAFEDKLDFDRWWDGNEMTEMRVITFGWWQVPLLYVPHDVIGEGRIYPGGNGDGRGVTPAPEQVEPLEPAPAAAS